jgi:predicted restriction endonuclease
VWVQVPPRLPYYPHNLQYVVIVTQKEAVRFAFREAVFKRDGHQCVFCNCREDLDAHHITDRSEMPNGGYVKENGITLCQAHHLDAEMFHISHGKKWRQGMSPTDLYKKIGSSKELAYNASLKLKI